MAKEKQKRIKKSLSYTVEGPAVSQTGSIEKPGIDQLESRIGGLDSKVVKIEADFKSQLNVEVEKFEEKIRDREIRTTEVLAIFIALFTFISVNVSIFTRVEDVHTAAWFVLLFTVCSLVLLSSLFLFISKDRNWYIIGVLLVSLCFLVVLLVATKYTQWNPKLNEVPVHNSANQ